MNDEMRSFCEEYAKAWYFGDPGKKYEWQLAYRRKRKEVPDEGKEEFDDYCRKCFKENENLLPYKENIGFIPFTFVKLEEE